MPLQLTSYFDFSILKLKDVFRPAPGLRQAHGDS